MAIFGLQQHFKEKILSEYFGVTSPDTTQKYIYVGLGYTQQGSNVNIESFDEVFDGENYGNYARTRIIFGNAVDGKIANVSDIAFPTATESWTPSQETISMLGLFDSFNAKDEEGNVILPIAVLRLPKQYTVNVGETIILSANSLVLNLSDI